MECNLSDPAWSSLEQPCTQSTKMPSKANITWHEAGFGDLPELSAVRGSNLPTTIVVGIVIFGSVLR